MNQNTQVPAKWFSFIKTGDKVEMSLYNEYVGPGLKFHFNVKIIINHYVIILLYFHV